MLFVVWTQRDSNCAQPPVKGSTFSINKKAPFRMLLCGPREIRTVRSLLEELDLLNVIEQLPEVKQRAPSRMLS